MNNLLFRCLACGMGHYLNDGHKCPNPLAALSVGSSYPTLSGCICPPGANLDCQAPACPRKPMVVAEQ